jgi:enoyl-CoA hydratase/carnithine racemase
VSIVEAEILKDEPGIHVVYLNNPETRNSMTLEMGLAFHRTFQTLASLDPLPRAVIITGRNDVFSAGGDLKLLKSFSEKSRNENREFMQSFYKLFLTVREMPFPVLACVNGHAVGAALALALACDLRYFLPDAKYAFNFVKIGIHPGMGSSFLVKEVAGMAQAQELLLTGRYISGAEAMQRGLCHGVFSADEIFDRTVDLAREIGSAAPLAVRLLKRSLYASGDLDQALQREAEAQAENYVSADFREAIAAIEDKRTPLYVDK